MRLARARVRPPRAGHLRRRRCGLNERSGPGYSAYPVVGKLYDGNEVDIVCQTRGQSVAPNHGVASNVWDRLTGGAYVTDVYVDTAGVGGSFSPPIPQC
jgi:hypothetical protein